MSHHHPPPPPSSCSCCCNCGCGYGCSPYPAPPAPVSSTDHLVHAIAAHLLLNASPLPPPQPQPQHPQPPPHHTNLYSYHYLKPQPQPNPTDHGHSHLLLHSLLRRVAALESSLPQHVPSPPPVPTRPNCDDHQKPPFPRARRAPSVRELAARTIQAHFRRFLTRRSRTLRQLKQLAILRSQSAALRSSASGRHGDPAAVSEAAMRLLLQLDAIQGGDPMIREGKRAVSRELTRILEFVDKVLAKEHEEMTMGGLEIREDHEGCNAGVMANPPAVNKKKVSFNGYGEVYELYGEAEEGDDGENSSESSSSAENDERKGSYGKKGANGLGLSAPMPVHMESRRSIGKRR